MASDLWEELWFEKVDMVAIGGLGGEERVGVSFPCKRSQLDGQNLHLSQEIYSGEKRWVMA